MIHLSLLTLSFIHFFFGIQWNLGIFFEIIVNLFRFCGLYYWYGKFCVHEHFYFLYKPNTTFTRIQSHTRKQIVFSTIFLAENIWQSKYFTSKQMQSKISKRWSQLSFYMTIHFSSSPLLNFQHPNKEEKEYLSFRTSKQGDGKGEMRYQNKSNLKVQGSMARFKILRNQSRTTKLGWNVLIFAKNGGFIYLFIFWDGTISLWSSSSSILLITEEKRGHILNGLADHPCKIKFRRTTISYVVPKYHF